MSPRRHLDDLFSAAYEDELSPIDEARFHNHMQSCEPCADAYAEFKATIAELHGLPRAPMPHVVHLPSTPPVAERPSRPRIGLSWFNLGLVRRFPASALAGGVALVLVIIALAHLGGMPTSTATPNAGSAGANGPNAAHAPALDAACVHSVVQVTGAAVPASFTHADLATDPAQPSVHLVLAAPTLVVTSGMHVVVYAEFSSPVAAITNPGSKASPPPARALLPCVTVGGVGTNAQALLVIPAGSGSLGSAYAPNGTPIGAPAFQANGGAGPFLTFLVPAGLAPGTELHVLATVPAGSTAPGSPALTAQLTLTTR
jgi:hypothetical protein